MKKTGTRNITREEMTEMIGLYNKGNGLSFSEIAIKLGRHRGTVRDHLLIKFPEHRPSRN